MAGISSNAAAFGDLEKSHYVHYEEYVTPMLPLRIFFGDKIGSDRRVDVNEHGMLKTPYEPGGYHHSDY